MAMRGSWKQWFGSPAPGDHIILWADDSEASDGAVATFVRGGLARNDLVLVTLPREELRGLEARLASHGVDLEQLVDDRAVLRIPFENAGPDGASVLEGIPAAIDSFLDLATGMGKSGLTVLGRVAPVFFEQGEVGEAERIEHLAHEHRRYARILCLYDGRHLTFDRLKDGVRVTRQHTHAATSVGGGRMFVKPVETRSEP